MGNSIIKLNESERKFLDVVLKNGNVNDSIICRETKLSKSSCSRIRKKLEKSLITEYIPIIDLDKVGINIFLVLTFQWIAFDNQKLTKETFEKFEKDPNVVFMASGEGSIASTVMFVAFENLEEYHKYLKIFRVSYGKYTNNVNTLLLPSKDVIKNDFTEVIRKIIVRS